MYEVLGILVLGIITGLIFRKKEKIIKTADQVSAWAVYLLLFLLGLSTGTNSDVISSLDKVGWAALVLTFGATGGSVVFSYFIYVCFFKEKSK